MWWAQYNPDIKTKTLDENQDIINKQFTTSIFHEYKNPQQNIRKSNLVIPKKDNKIKCDLS